MKDTLSSAVVWKVVTNLLGVATAFVSIRLYNLYLTKETYGAVLVAAQFLTYLPLVGGGFGMVVSQQILASHDPDERERSARYNQVLQSHILALALVVAVVMMAIYSQLPAAKSSGVPLPVYFAVGVAGVVTLYAGTQIGLLVPLGRQVSSIILYGAWTLLGVLVLWICFYLGLGVWAMPLSTALGAGLLVPVAWGIQRQLLPGLPTLSWNREPDFWNKLRETWAPSLRWLSSQVAIMFLMTLDIILMGMMFGPGPAAVYGIVSRVAGMSRQVINALCDTAWPRITQEPDAMRKAALMKKLDRLNAWITGGWYGAMGATLLPFLGSLMKADWVAGQLLVGLMLARNLILSMSAPHSYGLLSGGRFKELARAVQIEVALMVIFICLFGHFFGTLGVAIGALASTLGGSLWYLTYLYFDTASHTTWFGEWCGVYVRGVVAAGVAFLAAFGAWQAEHALSLPGWSAALAGGVGLAAAMAVGMIYGLKVSKGQVRKIGGVLNLPMNW